MRNLFYSIMAGCLCGATVVAGETNTLSVATLESLVAEHVNLRSQIAGEKLGWREQERAWRSEIELLRIEEKALQKEIDESREFETSIQETRTQLLDRQEKLKRVQTGILPHLERAEAELRKWRKQIPPSLASPLDKAFAELPSPDGAAAHAGLSRRLQLVVALFTQIETLQHGIHSTRELLALDGPARREMDILYLGLSRAFAVSADSRFAAVGRPSPDGWVWQPRHSLAPDIRKAISVFNKEATAELVDLPLQAANHETKEPKQ